VTTTKKSKEKIAMLNFHDLKTLIPEGGNVTINIAHASGERLAVLVHPRVPEIKDAHSRLSDAKKAAREIMEPKTILATPEELDGNFMGLLDEAYKAHESARSNILEISKAIKEKEEKAKSAAARAAETRKMNAGKKGEKSGSGASNTQTDLTSEGEDKTEKEVGEMEKAEEVSVEKPVEEGEGANASVSGASSQAGFSLF